MDTKLANQGNSDLVKAWPLGFCDCCSYRNSKGECTWCPYFVPMAVCGTCFLLGKIRTLYRKEEPCCCDMGTQGWCLCLISAPINVLGPLGGFCWFALNSAKMRSDIVKKYNIIDTNAEECCCCCSVPSCCVGICYPCSLFQVLMTMRKFEGQD